MQGKFILDIREEIFVERIVKHWHRLSSEAVESSSLEVFKNMRIWHLRTWLNEHGGGAGLMVGLDVLEIFFNLNDSVNLYSLQYSVTSSDFHMKGKYFHGCVLSSSCLQSSFLFIFNFSGFLIKKVYVQLIGDWIRYLLPFLCWYKHQLWPILL